MINNCVGCIKQVSNDVVSGLSMQQKAMIIAAPAAAVVGSKVVMGLGAAGCAVLSKVADVAGKKELSASLSNTKNNLFARATSFGKEVKVAAGLTIAAATGVVAATKFAPVPVPTYSERLALLAEQVRCSFS